MRRQKQTPATLGNLIAALFAATLPLCVLLAADWLSTTRADPARLAFESAMVTRFSQYEIVYKKPDGRLGVTTNFDEYHRVLKEFAGVGSMEMAEK